jgi:hypothetical protein
VFLTWAGLAAALNDPSLTVRAGLLATVPPADAPECTLRMHELFVWHVRAPVRLLLMVRMILHDLRCQFKTSTTADMGDLPAAQSLTLKLQHLDLVCSFLTFGRNQPAAVDRVRVPPDPYVALMATSLLHELGLFCQLWWSMCAPVCVWCVRACLHVCVRV